MNEAGRRSPTCPTTTSVASNRFERLGYSAPVGACYLKPTATLFSKGTLNPFLSFTTTERFVGEPLTE